jgi:hypothetical protein
MGDHMGHGYMWIKNKEKHKTKKHKMWASVILTDFEENVDSYSK